MSKVITTASMSLDGFISGPDESGFEHLFAWYGNGDVPVPTAQPERTFRMTPENARLWAGLTAATGALVTGRRLFDITGGWGGTHPLGVPVVVLTHTVPDDWPHPDAPFTFVTDGIESAVAEARRLADGKDVGVAAGTMAAQALDAGLLDEIWVMLTPVVLGGGTPFFEGLRQLPVVLDDPEVTVAAGVTHLRYTLRR
ncbi:dihydrofolate reductase family protein [Microbispora corallina]|uniref:Deaminase n=1 Tax=Microbispora corallina TaxID=83302 RepID=A0ABQ4GAL2_9ACTN|nr:dihydrofolate reductase family protein [Microbispora corallina]GIH43998.1 deaminase [Microbispora corallina]